MAIRSVKEYGGHGIGREMHEDPFIYNYYSPEMGLGPYLREGMCLSHRTYGHGWQEQYHHPQGWLGYCLRGPTNLPGHYENDVIITANGPIITSVDSNVKRHLSNGE